ncbi:MAG TPA: RidA family protein [Candidatus Methylomirabilis sp.]
MKIEEKIKSMGLTLPPVPAAVASYIPFVRVGDLLFLAGTTGEQDGKPPYAGRVGAEVTLEQAREAARRCGLNHLAMMKAALGDLDRVERIVRLIGYVHSAPGFTDQPRVVNGESDLYIALWGEQGRHARAALGGGPFYGNAPVETEVIVQVKAEEKAAPRAAAAALGGASASRGGAVAGRPGKSSPGRRAAAGRRPRR